MLKTSSKGISRLCFCAAALLLTSSPSKAEKWYCQGDFDPTPETGRHVFSDLFNGGSGREAYIEQFRAAIESRYQPTPHLRVNCQTRDSESAIRIARNDAIRNASEYANSNNAIQVYQMHWIPEDAIRLPN